MKSFLISICLAWIPYLGFSQYPNVNQPPDMEDDDSYLDLDQPFEHAPFWIDFGGGYANALQSPSIYGPTDILSGYYLTGPTFNFGMEANLGEESNFTALVRFGIIFNREARDRDPSFNRAVEQAYPDMLVVSTNIETHTEDESHSNQNNAGTFQIGLGYKHVQQRVTITGNLSVMFTSVTAMESFSRLKQKDSNKYFELTYEFEDQEYFNAIGPSIGAQINYRLADYVRIYASAQFGWLFYSFQYYEGLYDVYEQTYFETPWSYSGGVNTYSLQGGASITLF